MVPPTKDIDWFDNDDFWRTFYPAMFDADSFSRARAECTQWLALAGLESPRVLDLACGPGRHAVPLAEMGLNVTGVDLSHYLLHKAQDYAKQQRVVVTWTQHDMRTYHHQASYGLILNLFSSFGYFDTWDENQQVLNLCYRNLHPGGALIMELHGKEHIVRDLQGVHAQEFDTPELTGCVLYQRPCLSCDLTRLHNEWTLVCSDRVHRHEYSHFIYTAQELRMMAQRAGFQHIEIYGDINGGQYDLDSERLIVVAHKKNNQSAKS